MAMSPEWRRSFEQFEHRAEQGDAEAQYRLAILLERGWDSIPADTARSLSLLQRAAESQYAPAMNYLGFLYDRGVKYGDNGELKANRDSAIYWVKRSADMGDAKAMSNVGYMLLNFPDSIEKNDGELGIYSCREQRDSLAATYLKEASRLGQNTAMSMLGDLYRDGRGVEQDTLLAADCYEQALQHGLSDAEPRLIALMADRWMKLTPDSAYNLGVKYYNGAAPWAGVMLLKQASALPEMSDEELSNPSDSLKTAVSSQISRAATAMTMVADAIGRGYGHRYNHDESLRWYLKGAMAGNKKARQIVEETESFFPDTFTKISDSIEDFRSQLESLAPFL